MDVERLIELVKKRVLLYDLTHKDYKNTGLKAEVWESVAKEMRHDVTDVKLKWKTIKDGYLKYRKQVRQSAGTGKKVCHYVWKSQLKFLDNYHVTRKPKSLAKWRTSQTTTSPQSPSPADRDSSPATSVSPTPSTSAVASRLSTNTTQRAETPNVTKRKKNSPPHSDMDEVIHYLNEVREYDAADHLFKSYAVSFKRLTCQQQAHIKIEMAKLFANAELNLVYNTQQLTDASSNAHYQLQPQRTLMVNQNQVELEAYTVKHEMQEDM